MTSRSEPASVAVVGAGPAGLAAAVAAAERGLATTLVDSAARVGGQYWRHGPDGLMPGLHHDAATFHDLLRRFAAARTAGHLTHLPHHEVWRLAANADSCTLHAVDRRDAGAPAAATLRSDYLILATGAYDRTLPFPGWDLPGVLSVGAAQSLLKGSGVVVGPRVLVAGTGPFLLPVATSLAARGASVVGVHEANRLVAWRHHLPAVVRQPAKLIEAADYTGSMMRHRIPWHTTSIVVAAHGTQRLEGVTVARLNHDGSVRAASRRRVPVDVLAVGYGFAIQTELARQAGCELWAPGDGTLAVRANEHQATTNPRVFAAGETTGIGGAQLAVVEGTLAGRAVADATRAGLSAPQATDVARARRRLSRFAAALRSVYPIPPAWLAVVKTDTVVCRCEEVTVADIDAAITAGARDLRSVKLLSRAGMGWCQGRICGYAAGCLAARRTGSAMDLTQDGNRPVSAPVPLGLVAGIGTPEPDRNRLEGDHR